MREHFKKAEAHFGPCNINHELTKAGEVAYYYNFQWRTGGYMLGGSEHEGIDYPISLEYRTMRPNNLSVENYKEHTLVCSDCLDRKLKDEFKVVFKLHLYSPRSELLKYNFDHYSSVYQCDACRKKRKAELISAKKDFSFEKRAFDRPDLTYQDFFERHESRNYPLPRRQFCEKLTSNVWQNMREKAYCWRCEAAIWIPTLAWLDDKKQFSRFFVCDKCDPTLTMS